MPVFRTGFVWYNTAMNDEFEKIYRVLENASTERPSTIVAIDGPCASGKTTLAKKIAQRCRARVIPMDDFFLPPELRTPQRYAQPGGNVHYERFLKEVAPFLSEEQIGKEISYRPFCCKEMAFGPLRRIPWAPVTVVEGSYSLHEALRSLYDIRIFLTVDAEEQERRIRSREGPEGLVIFKEKWIPLESRYFETGHPEKCCDFIL